MVNHHPSTLAAAAVAATLPLNTRRIPADDMAKIKPILALDDPRYLRRLVVVLNAAPHGFYGLDGRWSRASYDLKGNFTVTDHFTTKAVPTDGTASFHDHNGRELVARRHVN